MLKLDTELANIKGIGEKFLIRLTKLEIKTVRDLLWHFPFRYEDYSKVYKIAELEPNQAVTIRGLVQKVATRQTWKKRMTIVEALITDETGGIKAIWFNQPYIAQALRVGIQANFSGKVSDGEDGVYLSNPAHETVRSSSETKHTAGLIPIYPETKRLTSKGLRFLVKPILRILEPLEDFIPKKILEKNNLPDINTALRTIHFPRTIDQAEIAKQRFAFEDLFLLQLNNLKIKHQISKIVTIPLPSNSSKVAEYINKLPFSLTGAQQRSLEEALSDLSHTQPMNRLLQGDVGSGKTVIAAIIAMVTASHGKQTAFMAPTEVLSRQHYRTLTKFFPYFPIGFLTSNEARAFYGEGLEGKKSKAQLLKEINSGEIKIIVGTHALIQKNAKFHDLATVVVDEQHRFGVQQRAELVARESRLPHFLSMSATPIPRTLSLTIFGDLDLSIIDEMPIGRKPVITKLVAPANRQKAYDFVREQIKNGRQAFVICPRIESMEPKKDDPDPVSLISQKQTVLWDVKAVKQEYEKLSKKIFPDLRVAMLHGKLKSKEKDEIMTKFSGGEIDVLVSTSVVEVGVDVPNASIMMIEGADRFGLSQLYQFRGRVGRGEHQSYCLLFTDSDSQSTAQRLEALIKARNGFELAEKDLQIRGPGQFLGDKQTGIPDLAMRSLTNMILVKAARDAAEEIIKEDSEFSHYPGLRQRLAQFKKTLHLE
ncbi:MAG: ATP-dependent DNA helicase RecG [Patescibacteria group bacterium]